MGCGSSAAEKHTSEPDPVSKSRPSIKTASTSEIEDLIGKKIPKVFFDSKGSYWCNQK